MTISTRLSIAGLVCVAVVAGIVGVVMSATWNVRSELAENEAASEILNAVTGLRYLTFDYALHHEARAQAQWQQRHASLSKLLEFRGATVGPRHGEVLAGLREANATLSSLFQQLAANRADLLGEGDRRRMAEDFEERVTSQIVVRLEAMIGDALGWSEESRLRVLAAQRRAMLTVSALGGLIVVVIGGALLLAHRSVSGPLRALQTGTAIIGAGDLEHRLAASGRDEIGDLARAFNAMAEKLQKDRADRMTAQAALERTRADLAHVARVATLGELTASIAHEVNQPLGAIVNNANAGLRWLAANNLEEARASLLSAVADGHRASEILARIREMVRKAPPQKEPVDINDAIGEVVRLAKGQAERCETAIESELCEEAPRVEADRVQIQQVTLNLLVNAFEAMAATPPSLRRVRVTSRLIDGGTLEVCVSDQGAGVDPARLDRLFDAFYTTKPTGLGMGLAICRAIVEDHRGQIRATVNPDRGTTLHFTLPVRGA